MLQFWSGGKIHGADAEGHTALSPKGDAPPRFETREFSLHRRLDDGGLGKPGWKTLLVTGQKAGRFCRWCEMFEVCFT